MSFVNEGAFLLLLLLPLLFLRRKSKPVAFSSLAFLTEISPSLRQRAAFSLPTLRALALALIVVALARPQEIDQQPKARLGIALELVVDRSSSMGEALAGSGKDRLSAVKELFADFILGDGDTLTGRSDDLLGIVAFARYADTICPLVRQPKAAARALDAVQLVTQRSEDGTAIGDALLLAAARLRQAEQDMARQIGEGEFSLKGKAIILLTDGQNNAGAEDPVAVAKKARDWGITIYTIGLEAEARGADPFASLLSMGRGVDSRLLEAIAEATEGRFFRARNSEELREVYAAIDRLEKTELESPEEPEGEDLFAPWAAAALIALALELILGTTILRRAP